MASLLSQTSHQMKSTKLLSPNFLSSRKAEENIAKVEMVLVPKLVHNIYFA